MDSSSVYQHIRIFLHQLVPLSQQGDVNYLLNPDNVIISEDSVHLQKIWQKGTQDSQVKLYQGYSAPENYQYTSGAPASVYFVGALAYTLLEGAAPPDARQRNNMDLLPNNNPFNSIINHSLKLNQHQRIQTLALLLGELNAIESYFYPEKALKTSKENTNKPETIPDNNISNPIKTQDLEEANVKNTENQPELSENKSNKKKKNKYIILLIVLIFLFSSAALAVFGYSSYQKTELNTAFNEKNFTLFIELVDKNPWLKEEETQRYNYAKAKILYNEGNIDQALPLFKALGDFKDSKDIVHSIQYNQASSLLSGGDLDNSLPIFVELAEYKDSAELADKIEKYYVARSNPDLLGQYQAYLDLGNFLDSEAKAKSLEEAIYNVGIDLFFQKNFVESVKYLGVVRGVGQAANYCEAAELWINSSDTATENIDKLPRLRELSATENVGPILLSNRYLLAFLRGEWSSAEDGGTLSVTDKDFSFSKYYFGGGNHVFSNGTIMSGDKLLCSIEFVSYNEIKITFAEKNETRTFIRNS